MDTTTNMNPELRAELVRLGWGAKLARVTWGRRVAGDMHGVTIEREGVVRYHPGPFSSIKRGDQIAIVRFG